jgi:hypothetical protein
MPHGSGVFRLARRRRGSNVSVVGEVRIVRAVRVPNTILWACGFVCGSIAFATNAAASPTARLVFSRAPGAESCPDEAALRRAVSARVGYDPFFAWADKTIVTTMTAAPPGFAAQVDMVDAHGVRHGARELHTEQGCGDLLEVAALAIAIAIDPRLLAVQLPPPAPAQPAEASPALDPVPAVPAAPPPPSKVIADAAAQPPAAPLRIEATAAAVVSVGAAPEPAAGFGLGFAVGGGALSLAVEGRVDAPTWEPAAGGGKVGAWLALGSLVPCVHGGPVFVCAIGQLGSMKASGEGAPAVRSETLPWRAVGGRFGATAPLSEVLAVRVGMDFLANLTRQTLALNGTATWTAPVVTASLGADVVVLFR